MHPGKTSIGRLGEGGQSAGRYKLQKGGCNRIFPISINENLLKQICEIRSVSSTHMLTKIGVANRQTDTRKLKSALSSHNAHDLYHFNVRKTKETKSSLKKQTHETNLKTKSSNEDQF